MRYLLTAIVLVGCAVAFGAEGALSRLPLAVVPHLQPGAGGATAWDQATMLGPFLRSDGTGMPAATTVARLGRSATALLLRLECSEPKAQDIQATIAERDGMVWVDDCVEVFIQPSGQPQYVHFVTNPLGTRFDERGRDAAWDGEWTCTAGRSDSAWWCEFRVPFAALGGSPVAGTEWRLNLCRSRRPEPELSTWSATGMGFHVPERFGSIRFADESWPALLSWSLSARREVSVELDWLPPGSAAGLDVTLDGADAGKPLRLTAEGAVALWLEARRGPTPIYRSCFVAFITPMSAAVRSARDAVAALPSGPEASVLAARVEALDALRDLASPVLATEIASQARELHLRASRLRLQTDLAAAGAPADGIVYGIQHSLDKLLRHEPFRGQAGGSVVLDAARNEMSAAQVALFAADAPLLMVEAGLSEVAGPDGAVLPVDAFRVRRVGYVPTCKPVYPVPFTGLWPDPLLEALPFDVRAHDMETLWVDVRVPLGAKPGSYRGSLTLSARNRRPTVVPLEVRVRAFTIPPKPSLSTAFGVSPAWRVPQDPAAYLRNALEHRISPYDVSAGPKLVTLPTMDWAGARRLRLSLTAALAGELRASVIPGDGSAALCLGPVPTPAGGVDSLLLELPAGLTSVRSWRIVVTGPSTARLTAVLEGAAGEMRLVDGADASIALGRDGWLRQWLGWEGSAWDRPDTPAAWDWTEFDTAFQAALDRGLTAHRAALGSPLGAWAAEYERHLDDKGWLPLFYTYLYDEPEPAHFDLVNQRLGAVKRAAPGLANMMTARQFPPELPYVDIWCPEAYSFDPEAAKAEHAKGKTVWWYVAFSTRHPFPNVWIDYPALDCRVWPWMTWKHDLDGMLYWSATYWSLNDPWRTGETFHDANGDGSLLYPGNDGRPVDSIRWECLRDGLEDYEVFCLLEAGARELAQAGQKPELVAQAKGLCAIDDQVVRSYKDYNPDPRALLATRAAMSDTLEAIVSALGREPAISGRPRRRVPVATPVVPPAAPLPAPSPAPWTLPPPAPEPGLVLYYDFEQTLPFAVDRSGRGSHGLVSRAEPAEGARGRGLRLHEQGAVELAAGAELLGDRPAEGTVALWACPSFAPEALPAGLYEGYAVLFYAMKTDGNGLPDGYDEIGLYLHGPNLHARAGGRNCLFATHPNPMRRGIWTHLALAWGPSRRVLYVDGKAAVERQDDYDLPALDAFRSTLGAHAPSLTWSFQGTLDDVRVYNRTLTAEEIARLATR